MKRGGVVYIMANNNRKVLYTGVTSDLISRVIQHKEKKFRKVLQQNTIAAFLFIIKALLRLTRLLQKKKELKEATGR